MTKATTMLAENYATTPVPQDKTYSGWRVGFVIGGIGIALPALFSGAEVGQALGFKQSALAFLASGILVTFLAIISGFVGMRSRLSTYMILRFSFGLIGAKIVSFTFALSQFGWFGVNAYFFGTSAEAIGTQVFDLSLPSQAYVILGGILMTLATIFGYKALDKIALFIFPLMLATLMFMIARTFALTDINSLIDIAPTNTMTFPQAVTLLSGGIIVGVLLIPDLTRYARGPVDVIIAVLIALALIEPIVHLAASGASIYFKELEPLPIMLALGFGGFAMAFLVLTSVTTNAVNLYGSGLSLASIFPSTSEWKFVLIAGIFGTAMGTLEVSDLFLTFLYWQSVLFSAVLGIYVVDFFFVRKGQYQLEDIIGEPPISIPAITAWAVGASVAALSYVNKITFTTMPNLDGVIVAGFVYFLMHKTLLRKEA